MAKIVASAVVILVALWLIPDLHAAEINHESNFEGSDFFFDEKQFSLNKSSQHGHSARFKAEESDKDKDHKSIHKFHESRPPESTTSTWNLKRLLQYIVFLLRSISAKNSHESELPNEDEHERVVDSKSNKTNQTDNTPRNFKSANIDNGSDFEFENSGEGDDNDYYDGENLNRNTKISHSTILKDFNTSMNTKSVVQNQEGISRDSIRNHAGNKKLTGDILQSHQAFETDLSLRDELVSGEFIDKIINRPITDVPVEESGKSTNNQPIIQKESRKLNYSTLEENVREGNIPRKENGELINIETPVSSKIVTKTNLTSSKGRSGNDFFRTERGKLNRTSKISLSNQAESETSKNFSTTSALKTNPKNYSVLNSNPLLISETPSNTENYTLKVIPFYPDLPKQTDLSKESKTQKHLTSTKETVNTNKPTDVFNTTYFPQSESSSYYFQKYNHEPQNRDVTEGLEAAHQHAKSPLLYSLSENKSVLSETHQKKDTAIIDSSTIRPKFTDLNPQKPDNIPKLEKDTVLHSTSFVSPPLEKTFNLSRNLRIFKQNSTFPKEIKLSRAKNIYFTITKNNTYDKSSENFSGLGGSQKNSSLSESSLNPEPQLQSQKKSDDTVRLMPHYQLNITKDIVLHDELNSTDILSPQNEPTEIENSSTKLKNIDILNKQHSVSLVKYPKVGEKQNRENFNISDKLKGKKGSGTDFDSSEDNSSDESYEDEEYDEDEQQLPDFTDYVKKIISNVTTHLSQNSTSNRNYSVTKELPVVSKNESKTIEFPKALEIFDSILEFIYKHSKNSLFTKMREQTNVTTA